MWRGSSGQLITTVGFLENKCFLARQRVTQQEQAVAANSVVLVERVTLRKKLVRKRKADNSRLARAHYIRYCLVEFVGATLSNHIANGSPQSTFEKGASTAWLSFDHF